MSVETREPTPRSRLYGQPVFDGFPYLVSRVHPALYHLIVLPGDRAEEELQALAQRQAAANRLETFLALGSDGGIHYDGEGPGVAGRSLPRCSAFVCNRLLAAEAFPDTPELAARKESLRSYIEAQHLTGYLVGNPERWERPANSRELAELTGFGPRGAPLGLVPCPVCRELVGTCRRKGTAGGIVTAHCRCGNHNRCARCGEPLYDRRLNAFFYDQATLGIWFTPGFCAFSHRGPEG